MSLVRRCSKPLHAFLGTAAMLFILSASQVGCDFRQITEDRPLKLPAESTKPKDTHPAPTSEHGGEPPGQAGTP